MERFGTCPCGGRYEERSVEVRLQQDRPEPVVLTGVPQGVCSVCGGRVYPAAVLSRIERLMRRRDETVRAP